MKSNAPIRIASTATGTGSRPAHDHQARVDAGGAQPRSATSRPLIVRQVEVEQDDVERPRRRRAAARACATAAAPSPAATTWAASAARWARATSRPC
jgi:hypothetical protein